MTTTFAFFTMSGKGIGVCGNDLLPFKMHVFKCSTCLVALLHDSRSPMILCADANSVVYSISITVGTSP
jgi:hypothetical protein